ncbi:MAG: tRNA epoxyqueuosine(34) reductase QueG [bacterium]|nr:tRNA epoxyqueuosine(34) reductase QueG [bacterium]
MRFLTDRKRGGSASFLTLSGDFIRGTVKTHKNSGFPLRTEIEKKALETGFDKIGIAPAEKLDERFFGEWLENDYHAGMKWMERNRHFRLDPGEYFPGTKSIISVVLNYYNEDENEKPDGTGQISRYAVGRDYHNVMIEMLKDLAGFITVLIPGAEYKIAVDTAPVFDKIWAEKAGLGWIGKHSNLITRESGSYVFIGEILLTAELPYDKPGKNHCGTCTKCVEACPTGAIVEPYVVDSRKCISYRTIERNGAVPPEWTGANADWLFGCDICQEVCPWNKFAKQTEIPDFFPKNGIRYTDPVVIKDMDGEEFGTIFRDSPVKRCKIEGYKRNAVNVVNYLNKREKQ